MLIWLFVKIILHFALRNCKQPKIVRLRDWITKELFWNQIISYIDESFLIICACSMANALHLNWIGPGYVINSITAITMFTVIIVYTVLGYYFLLKYHDKLRLKSFTSRFGNYYMHLRIKYKESLAEPFCQKVRIIFLISSILLL